MLMVALCVCRLQRVPKINRQQLLQVQQLVAALGLLRGNNLK